MSSKGFIYIATGKRFIDEAAASYASLIKHMPDAKVCCFTDDPDYARTIFPRVELIEKPYRNFLEKIPPLWQTPFDRSIFVDTDTLFASSVEDIFDLLERFELAVAPDPFWVEAPDCPACFQHMNTGLIAYRRSEHVFSFFERWFQEFKIGLETDPKNPIFWHDQVVFQKELFRSDLRFYVLPNEYNLRVTCPQLVRIWAKAKMLHGRDPANLKRLGNRLAQSADFRLVMPNWTFIGRTDVQLVLPQQRWLLDFLNTAVRRTVKTAGQCRSVLKRRPALQKA